MIAQLGHLRQRFISIQCYRWNINAGDYFWGMWNGTSLKFSTFKWTEDWNNSTISNLSCKWTKFLQQIIVYQLLSSMFLQWSSLTKFFLWKKTRDILDSRDTARTSYYKTMTQQSKSMHLRSTLMDLSSLYVLLSHLTPRDATLGNSHIHVQTYA